ncbi:myosin-IIIa-like [Ptychodera flava]|uniref:myosin-IIIa-like n=1 Tax=Ptychodera flava TaxID=63121 RepID=UPI003969F4CC
MADGKLVDDLATLSSLNEKNILGQLNGRFKKDLIYTYIGDILVAVNPYHALPIYSHEESNKYVNLKYRRSIRPHIFAVADKAYQQMKRTGINQCCVISGESGAGKTESTKLLIQHIMNHCHSRQHGLQDKILQVNPLLEAFGNAKTVMNQNSSRFGKFVDLKFTADGNVDGAGIEEYLLEKSRVIFQNPGERNFHIFYYMFAGLSESELLQYYLISPDKHRILNGNHSLNNIYTSVADFNYCQSKYDELKSLMVTVGFSDEDMYSIQSVLAAILNLSDIEFKLDNDLDSAYITDEYFLKVVGNLLSVDPVDLAAALISTTSYTRGERIVMLKNVDQANDGRDAVCKALYGRLFGWIVCQVNDMLASSDEYSDNATSSVGILDISGFENFKHNSFEQLCINMTNEQLQYYFNQNIFAWEQNEYAQEGISMTTIKFSNNKHLLELLMARPVGLLALLDEESRFPKATDDSLVQKFNDKCGKNPGYIAATGINRGAVFGIHHYAGQVTYNADGFLEKNRDTLNQNLLECLTNSENAFVCRLFKAKISRTGSMSRRKANLSRDRKAILLCNEQPDLKPSNIQRQRSRGPREDNQGLTVSAYFKESLTDLMEKMLSAEPQFVRCIKPNVQKQAGRFDDKIVLNQLRCTGVLETVKIRHTGYSIRLSFQDFIQRYKFLRFPMTARIQYNSMNCHHLLESTGLAEWQVGKTKVFLKYWHTEQLDSMMDAIATKVITIQKIVRGWLAKRTLRRLRHKSKVNVVECQRLLSQIQLCGDEFVRVINAQSEHDKKRQLEVDALQKMLIAKGVGEKKKRDEVSPVTMATVSAAAGTKSASTPEIKNDNNNESFVPSETQQLVLEDTLRVIPKQYPSVWCRLYFIEKSKVLDAFSIASPALLVDGSSRRQRGRIGFSAMSDRYSDAQSKRIRQFIGKGVQLEMDSSGNLWASRLSKNAIFVKGWKQPQYHSISADIIKHGGQLPYGKAVKIFDIKEFKVRVAMQEDPVISRSLIQHTCVVSLSFIKNVEDDDKTPCWISIVVLQALHQKMRDPDILEEIEEIRQEYRTAKEIKEDMEKLTKKRAWAKLHTRASNMEKNRKAGRNVRLMTRQKAIAEGMPWKYSWENDEEGDDDGHEDDEYSRTTKSSSEDSHSSAGDSNHESSFYGSESATSQHGTVSGSDIHRAALEKLQKVDPGVKHRKSIHMQLIREAETLEKEYTSNLSGQNLEKRRQWAKVKNIKRQDQEREATEDKM